MFSFPAVYLAEHLQTSAFLKLAFTSVFFQSLCLTQTSSLCVQSEVISDVFSSAPLTLIGPTVNDFVPLIRGKEKQDRDKDSKEHGTWWGRTITQGFLFYIICILENNTHCVFECLRSVKHLFIVWCLDSSWLECEMLILFFLYLPSVLYRW